MDSFFSLAPEEADKSYRDAELDDLEEDWSAVLDGHPIFSFPQSQSRSQSQSKSGLKHPLLSFELSTETLPDFASADESFDGPPPSGRRQTMLVRDADLVVAAGEEVRMTTLGEATKNRVLDVDGEFEEGGKEKEKEKEKEKLPERTYKVLHTPNVEFDVHQMALNPNGKLLAVAGEYQVAVIVLPRTGFSKLVTKTIDCKSIQVGQYYHASPAAAPVAKIEWHPWGDAGTTLLVMTTDGQLREYDIAVDADEPQQIFSFLPERKGKTFAAADASERQAATFVLGQGTADWRPLTIYGLMRSGDVYAICPYMPKNASLPSAYVHALDNLVSSKQIWLEESLLAQPSSRESLSTYAIMYDRQRKYVQALLKQLPPGANYSAISRYVLLHPPIFQNHKPLRQGPFRMQPEPVNIEGSEGAAATDLVYAGLGGESTLLEEDVGEEGLGVVGIVYQDGKVEVCLDVEKIEARWDNEKEPYTDLPLLVVYETIDLGLVSLLSKGGSSTLELLKGNHPVFLRDPVNATSLYVYHAFGVHALDLKPFVDSLSEALSEQGDVVLEKVQGTDVTPMWLTYSAQKGTSHPVVALTVPNDVYLTYSIFMLTSAMRLATMSLPAQISRESPSPQLGAKDKEEPSFVPEEEADMPSVPLYVSLLSKDPYVVPPVLEENAKMRRLSIPEGTEYNEGRGPNRVIPLSTKLLQFLTHLAEQYRDKVEEVHNAYGLATVRSRLQREEFERQKKRFKEVQEILADLKGRDTQRRVEKLLETQKTLVGRLDRLLQALMRKVSPELSEQENKWFEELKRMKAEVMGVGRYDPESLVQRSKVIKRDYDRLIPKLEEVHAKEVERKLRAEETNKRLGFRQAFELGERSNLERVKIINIEDAVLQLAAHLDVALERPPALDSSSDE